MTSSRNDRSDSLPPRNLAYSDQSSSSPGLIVGSSLLMVVGVLNFIHGLTLFESADFLENSYLYDNLTFWAWAFTIWGVLQAGAGLAALTMRDSSAGIVAGITLASIGIVGWFFMIFAAPAAAIVGILLNVIVVYGLSTAD